MTKEQQNITAGSSKQQEQQHHSLWEPLGSWLSLDNANNNKDQAAPSSLDHDVDVPALGEETEHLQGASRNKDKPKTKTQETLQLLETIANRHKRSPKLKLKKRKPTKAAPKQNSHSELKLVLWTSLMGMLVLFVVRPLVLQQSGGGISMSLVVHSTKRLWNIGRNQTIQKQRTLRNNTVRNKVSSWAQNNRMAAARTVGKGWQWIKQKAQRVVRNGMAAQEDISAPSFTNSSRSIRGGKWNNASTATAREKQKKSRTQQKKKQVESSLSTTNSSNSSSLLVQMAVAAKESLSENYQWAKDQLLLSLSNFTTNKTLAPTATVARTLVKQGLAATLPNMTRTEAGDIVKKTMSDNIQWAKDTTSSYYYFANNATQQQHNCTIHGLVFQPTVHGLLNFVGGGAFGSVKVYSVALYLNTQRGPVKDGINKLEKSSSGNATLVNEVLVEHVIQSRSFRKGMVLKFHRQVKAAGFSSALLLHMQREFEMNSVQQGEEVSHLKLEQVLQAVLPAVLLPGTELAILCNKKSIMLFSSPQGTYSIRDDKLCNAMLNLYLGSDHVIKNRAIRNGFLAGIKKSQKESTATK